MNAIQSGSTGNEMLTPDQSILSELPDSISEDLRDRFARFIKHSSSTESLLGPLPPPGLLAQYDPDVQKLILDAAVADREQRAAMEVRQLRRDFYRRILGMLVGFVLALAVIISSLHMILSGHSDEGLIAIGISIAVAAITFVYTEMQARKHSETMSELAARVESRE